MKTVRLLAMFDSVTMKESPKSVTDENEQGLSMQSESVAKHGVDEKLTTKTRVACHAVRQCVQAH